MSDLIIKVQRTENSRISSVDFKNIAFGKTISDHMFVVDYDGEKWVDARIEPYGNFSMPPANLALHYGQSIFEGMKATKVNGKPYLFRPMMHAQRLNQSAERMCMPRLPEELFMQGVNLLTHLDSNWIPDEKGNALYIRPFMFATDALFGMQSSKTYRFVIFTGPVGPYYAKPVSLWVEEVYTRAAMGGAGEAKCAGNYGASLLPTYKAKDMGYDQVMWMDSAEKRYIQEVGTMNLFFVIDGKVLTPTTTGTILRGITRDSFITLLKDKGYEVYDRRISIHELYDAHLRGTLTEVFGAGTAAVVSNVSSITWRERKMVLPEVNAENRPVATLLKSYIDELRAGQRKDQYGWMHDVEEYVMENIYNSKTAHQLSDDGVDEEIIITKLG